MRVWDRFLTERDQGLLKRIGTGSHDGVGKRPALVVIDVTQAFFGDRDEPILESTAEWPFSCGGEAWAALPNIARLLEAFRSRRLPVFFSNMPDGGSPDLWRSSSADAAPTSGGDDRPFEPQSIMAEVAPRDGEIVITKSTPSVFFGTPLMSQLTALGVDSVVLCGTSTSGCVRSTAVEAFANSLSVAVVEDGVFDRFEASHAMALFDLHFKYAHVTDSVDIATSIAALDDDLFEGRRTDRGISATITRAAKAE